jgi:hypothetical protein
MTEPLKQADAKGPQTSGNRIQPVRLTLPMMLDKAGLDAFLQCKNEV